MVTTLILALVLMALLALRLPRLACPLQSNIVLQRLLSASIRNDWSAEREQLGWLVDGTRDAILLGVVCPLEQTAPSTLGTLYARAGELEIAAQWYQRAMDLNRGNPVVLFQVANLHEQRGEHEQAISLWRQAHSASYFHLAGQQLLEKNISDVQAYRQLKLVLEIDPAYPKVSFYIAWSRAARAQGQWDESMTALEAGLTRVTLPNERAELYAYLGDGYGFASPPQWSKALDYYRQAVELSPATAADRLRLAEAYRMTRQFRHAEIELQAMMLLVKDSIPEYQANAYFEVGLFDMTTCRWENAAGALEMVLKLTPANSTAQLLLGQAYRRLGRFDDARLVLGKALQSSYLHIRTGARYQLDRLGQTDPEMDAYCRAVRENALPGQER